MQAQERLLRRQDAISYNHDAFEKVHDDYVSGNRGSTPAEWKQFARKRGARDAGWSEGGGRRPGEVMSMNELTQREKERLLGLSDS
jgi:hypothetical protein